MEALSLDAAGYAGTYKLVGGRVSLDFVNTLAWAGTEREHDWFAAWPNVLDWAVASGFLSEQAGKSLRRRYGAEPRTAASAVRVIQDRRRTLRDVILPLAQNHGPNRRYVGIFNELLRASCSHREIDPDSLRWTYGAFEDLEDLTVPAVLDAAELITSADYTRVGACPACGWLFYDTSRNRSRRWCDMEDCGSRAKALSYYHRRRNSEHQ